MDEYYGSSAKLYKQTRGKLYTLFPAIKRALADTRSGVLLDLGCGSADLPLNMDLSGFTYTGIDVSEDMVRQAKEKYPHGTYHCASAVKFSHLLKEKNDIVIMSMLFGSMNTYEDIAKTMQECVQVLAEDGKILIGIAHPNYDGYMRYGFFQRENVETDFTGYFDSGKLFYIKTRSGPTEMKFADYHWTLQDYARAITEAGLCITTIDECPVDASLTDDKVFIERRKQYPTYMLIVAEKK